MPQERKQLHLHTTSDAAAVAPVRRAVEDFFSACGADRNTVADLGLCVNEALANVIRHAYGNRPGQPIQLWAAATGDDLCIHIRDWGNGVDPSQLPLPPRAALEPGGLGLVCLRTLMDEVRYEPQPDGMSLRLRRRCPAGRRHRRQATESALPSSREQDRDTHDTAA